MPRLYLDCAGACTNTCGPADGSAESASRVVLERGDAPLKPGPLMSLWKRFPCWRGVVRCGVRKSGVPVQRRAGAAWAEFVPLSAIFLILTIHDVCTRAAGLAWPGYGRERGRAEKDRGDVGQLTHKAISQFGCRSIPCQQG